MKYYGQIQNEADIINKKYADEHYADKTKIVGQAIPEGGEIFNDYENNTANGKQSHAEGFNTKANIDYSHTEGYGTETLAKAYTINSVSEDGTTITFVDGTTLITDGVTAGMLLSFLTEEYKYLAKILEVVDETTITLDSKHGQTQTVINSNILSQDVQVMIDGGAFGNEPYIFPSNVEISAHAEGRRTKAYVHGHAEGRESEARGHASHAEGRNTIARGEYSHAEGYYSETIDNVAHAEGSQTKAVGSSSHAEGFKTISYGEHSHAEGAKTIAGLETTTRTAAHAEGFESQATGNYSHAEGEGSIASAQGSHAEGYKTQATKKYSHAEGYSTQTTGDYSHAEGYNNVVSGIAAHAEGQSTQVSGNYAHAEGQNTQATNIASHAEGNGALASGEYSHAEGKGTHATKSAAHAEGDKSSASGDYSHAEGYNTLASGASTHAEGNSTQAIGDNSHAEGNKVKAHGASAHAEGNYSEAFEAAAHAEGNYTKGNGLGAHSEGDQSQAYGQGAHAEGYKTSVGSSENPVLGGHAEGNNTIVNGSAAHAEGNGTHAEATYSHAEGYQTYAEGISSHAEGTAGHAIGEHSHVEGYKTYAKGNSSHAEGSQTIAGSNFQHVQGKFNVEDTENKYAHVVGNGTSNDKRKNIHTLNWDGNAWFKGDVLVGGTGQDDTNAKMLATTDMILKDVDLTKVATITEGNGEISEKEIKNGDWSAPTAKGTIDISGYVELEATSTSIDTVSLTINGNRYNADGTTFPENNHISFKGNVTEPISFEVYPGVALLFTKFVATSEHILRNEIKRAVDESGHTTKEELDTRTLSDLDLSTDGVVTWNYDNYDISVGKNEIYNKTMVDGVNGESVDVFINATGYVGLEAVGSGLGGGELTINGNVYHVYTGMPSISFAGNITEPIKAFLGISSGISFSKFKVSKIDALEKQVGDFDAALDAAIALCDKYIGGEIE